MSKLKGPAPSINLDTISLDLRRDLANLTALRRQFRQIPRELEARERQIREDDELTEEQKRAKIRRAREDLRAKQARIVDQFDAVVDDFNVHYEQHGRTQRAEPEVYDRVRDLLREGHSPQALIRQALTDGDPDTIYAVKAEAKYAGAPPAHGAKRGSGSSFPDPDEIDRACDLALAGLGDERSILALQAESTFEPMETLEQFATKAVAGQATPKDRIASGFAQGDSDGPTYQEVVGGEV